MYFENYEVQRAKNLTRLIKFQKLPVILETRKNRAIIGCACCPIPFIIFNTYIE